MCQYSPSPIPAADTVTLPLQPYRQKPVAVWATVRWTWYTLSKPPVNIKPEPSVSHRLLSPMTVNVIESCWKVQTNKLNEQVGCVVQLNTFMTTHLLQWNCPFCVKFCVLCYTNINMKYKLNTENAKYQLMQLMTVFHKWSPRPAFMLPNFPMNITGLPSRHLCSSLHILPAIGQSWTTYRDVWGISHGQSWHFFAVDQSTVPHNESAARHSTHLAAVILKSEAIIQ